MKRETGAPPSVAAKRPVHRLALPALLPLAVALAWPALGGRVQLGGTGLILPWIVLGLAAVLALRFHSGRTVLVAVVLCLGDAARVLVGFVEPVPGLGAATAGPLSVALLAALVPLDVAALALLKERGLVTSRGGLRVAVLGLQAGLVVTLARNGVPGSVGVLTAPPEGLATELVAALPLVAAVAYGLAFVLVLIALLRRGTPLEAGFLGALVPAFMAWRLGPADPDGRLYLLAAGLALCIAVLESSHALAFRDELTGLPGRRAFNDALLRLGTRYTLAMVDIDHFKRLNDKYGHDVGDQALRMVAARLAEVSGGGRVFRYGGEEFAIVFPGKAASQAAPHLESLRTAIAETRFAVRGPDRPKRPPRTRRPGRRTSRPVISLTVSIGVAERDGRRPDPELVMRAADQLLYRAKKRGRNRVEA